MPRVARRKSESNIYHVMVRGINQQNIFVDEEDNLKYLDLLARYQKEFYYSIYAYCLMGNHVHILIKEGAEDLSNTMRRMGISYAQWYNWQYNRKGHLFQGRYKSEPVEDESYFLTVIRYIHQNPLNAGLVNCMEEYKWSSYGEYITQAIIIDVDYVLAFFSGDRETALREFVKFNKITNDDKCLDIIPKVKTRSDKEMRQVILGKYGIELAMLQNEDAKVQAKVLKYAKDLEGSSLRQLSRLTGLTVNKIYRM